MKELLIMLIDAVASKHEKDPRGRKAISTEEYLNGIMKVLKSGMQWYYLNEKLHYTAYNKKHLEWSRMGVYDTAYKICLKLCKFTTRELKNLYIDSSMVKNIKGKDVIGINHYDRHRSATKINVIVTSKGIPLSIQIVEANKHDASITADSVKDITLKVVGSRLIADKGYISKKQKENLKKKSITLIYPYRKNQKQKLSYLDLFLLKGRYIVEHFFSWLKNYRKIRIRTDITIDSFSGFVLLASMDMVFNKREITSLELV